MIFADRITAAGKLAEALSEYQDKNPLILAIPSAVRWPRTRHSSTATPT